MIMCSLFILKFIMTCVIFVQLKHFDNQKLLKGERSSYSGEYDITL